MGIAQGAGWIGPAGDQFNQGGQSSFLAWAGPSGAAMPEKVEALVGGVRAGMAG